MKIFQYFFVSILVALFTSSAVAQEFGLSEIRAGIMAHSVDEPGPQTDLFDLSRVEDVNFEVLFTSPDIDAFRWIGSPKPNLGGTFHFGEGESMIHLALTWQVQVFDTPLFVEGSFGGAINNGAFEGATYPNRNLGCPLMFYESVGIGMDVSDSMRVIAAVEHASNANLCDDNRGLSNAGLKLSYKF